LRFPSLFSAFFPGCLEVDEHPEDPGVVGGYRGVVLVFFLVYLLFTAKEGCYLNVFSVSGFFLTSFLVTFYKKNLLHFCVLQVVFSTNLGPTMIIASFPFTGTANQVGSKFSAD
jgi:hypothetical protein